MKKIAVIGLGYVGTALSILLGKDNEVFIYDINPNKIEQIKNNLSPINDKFLIDYLNDHRLHIKGKDSFKEAVKDAEYVFISTPTDYDEKLNRFDTSSVESCIKESIKVNPNINIVIKSTVPIGFSDEMIAKYHYDKIFFVPEFLREGHALYDNLYPSRIIVGTPSMDDKYLQIAANIKEMLKNAAEKEDVKSLIITNKEAESSKLFANAYLAMRVSFFNELDSYAETNKLNTKNIIDAICLDERIGDFYNNPSFGYGGYCLPKDSKQLKASFGDVPNSQISAIVKANELRKKYIADQVVNKIKNKGRPIIGVYRLTMKQGSDNFRNSSIIDVILDLKERLVPMIIYEPTIKGDEFMGITVTHDLDYMKHKSWKIIANRYDKELDDVKYKVYTRDIYNKD